LKGQRLLKIEKWRKLSLLKKKIKAIKKDGLEKFFVLSDFEGILTKVFYRGKLKEFGLKSSHLRKINPFNNIFYKCFE
jgi:hypothetical protein